MKSKRQKYCAVPQCDNNLKKTPEKLFISVPYNKKMRKKWFSLARRDPNSYSFISAIYFCEDHFDLPNDMANYTEYHVMGTVSHVLMKPGCVPTKFACQPDRRKRSSSTERPYIIKKQRKLLVDQCLQEINKDLETGQASSTCNQVVFTARGLVPPVFTPLNDDLSINYAAIPSYAKFLADNGIKSVLVGGTTGEHMSLSVADRKKVIEAWVAAGKVTKLHIMVQVGGAPSADVVELAAFSQAAGADSLLTLPELYFKPATVDELVANVALVARAAPKLPVLYYHIPSMSKVEINMPAFIKAATASIPNFKGIKFTSNDLSEGAQAFRALQDGQELFLGADTLLAPAALLGIKSSIGTTFNLFPRLAQDILDAVENNNVSKARALQEKLSLAVEAHTVEGPWVPIMKAGMEIVTGIKVGPPSLPQRPLSEAATLRIKGKLKTLGFYSVDI